MCNIYWWYFEIIFVFLERNYLNRGTSKSNKRTGAMSVTSSNGSSSDAFLTAINVDADKYPFCIVWTPIPVLTWFFPFIGHMGRYFLWFFSLLLFLLSNYYNGFCPKFVGVAMSNGVIRDFAGPYFVSEDNMAFGRPTRYLRLDVSKVRNGSALEWDEGRNK